MHLQTNMIKYFSCIFILQWVSGLFLTPSYIKSQWKKGAEAPTKTNHAHTEYGSITGFSSTYWKIFESPSFSAYAFSHFRPVSQYLCCSQCWEIKSFPLFVGSYACISISEAIFSTEFVDLGDIYLYISAPKILVVSQKPLIRTSTLTFLRQNSHSSSIMIWKAGRFGDAADRIWYDSMYQLHIYMYICTYVHHAHTAVFPHMPAYTSIQIQMQYTFIYKYEHFECIGRYKYVYLHFTIY